MADRQMNLAALRKIQLAGIREKIEKLDTLEAIATKVEVRQFSSKPVPDDIKQRVLEAARLTGSSNNTQHWRFVLLQEKGSIGKLADDATSGGWVRGANFAIIVLTDPTVRGYMIDAGRVLQDMQLASWSLGVGSGIFTGINEEKLRKDFAIPQNLQISACLGFGYPANKVTGKKKNRKPLSELVSIEKFGSSLESNSQLK